MHVDVFDGSTMCNGNLSSLGPAVIASLRAAHPQSFLDVHLCVDVSKARPCACVVEGDEHGPISVPS